MSVTYVYLNSSVAREASRVRVAASCGRKSQSGLASARRAASSFGLMEVNVGLGADLRYLESGSATDVRGMLDSKFPQEKLHGMKSIFGMAMLNQPVTNFFADVVKNVGVENMEVKKLVYMYLVQYASEQPDLALLSINSFQRDLSDHNAMIRALALRVMTSIRVPIIRPLLLISMQKCVSDSSAHVRKSVANALPNLLPCEADEPDGAGEDGEVAAAPSAAGASSTPYYRPIEPPPELLELLQKLLGDRVPSVLGAAASAFLEIAPHRLDILHQHYHSMVGALAEADEWGQALLLEVLLRYVSANFPEPRSSGASTAVSTDGSADGWNPNYRGSGGYSSGGGFSGSGGGSGGGSGHCGFGSGGYGGADAPSYGGIGYAGGTGGCSGGSGSFGASPSIASSLQSPDDFYADIHPGPQRGGGGGGGGGGVPATPPRDLMYESVPDAPSTAPQGDETPVHSFGQPPYSPAHGQPPAVSTSHSAGGGDLDHETREELAALLKACRLALLSSNGAVVLAASALLRRLLPFEQLSCIARPLCRLTRSSRPEIAFCALEVVHALAVHGPALFASATSDFFASADEPGYLIDAKCRILSVLVSPATVGPISRELTAYLRSATPRLAKAAASAVAECATRMPVIAEPCLSSLVSMLSYGEEGTVATAIDAIRRVLQAPSLPAQPRVVTALALLLPQVRVPHARAMLVWCVGEYIPHIPRLACETLRVLLIKFHDEPTLVKLQVLTLAAKCAASAAAPPQPSTLMLRYALDLAKYDLDCDVRARARLLAAVGLDAPSAAAAKPNAASLLDDPAGGASTIADADTVKKANPLAAHAHLLLCPPKPTDAESATNGAPRGGLFTLTSVSLLLGKAAPGYRPLSTAPPTRTDPALRRAMSYVPSSSPSNGYGGSGSGYGGQVGGYGGGHTQPAGGGGFYDDVSDPSTAPPAAPPHASPHTPAAPPHAPATGTPAASGGGNDSEYSYYSDEDDDDAPGGVPKVAKGKGRAKGGAKNGGAGSESLLGDRMGSAVPPPMSAAVGGGWVAGGSTGSIASVDSIAPPLDDAASLSALLAPTSLEAPYSPAAGGAGMATGMLPPMWTLLLDYTNGNGLNVRWRFARDPTSAWPATLQAQATPSARLLLLEYHNTSTMPFTQVSIVKPQLGKDQSLTPGPPVTLLPSGSTCVAHAAIELAGLRTPLKLQLATDRGAFPVEVRPPQGELLLPKPITLDAFEALRTRLGGMNTASAKLPPLPGQTTVDLPSLASTALQYIHAAIIPAAADGAPTVRLSACGHADGRPMLAVLVVQPDASLQVSVHADDAIGGNILKEELVKGLRGGQ